MRNGFLATLAVLACVGTAMADFSGPYAPENWTFFKTNSFYGHGTLTAEQMTLNIDVDLDSAECGYRATIAEDTQLTFDWSYDANPYGGFPDDPYGYSYYFANGQKIILSYLDGSGTVTVDVSAGDVFGFGVLAQMGYEGTMGITNFAYVPEPASLTLLALGTVALWRRR